MDSLLKAFEKIKLRDREVGGSARRDRRVGGTSRDERGERAAGSERTSGGGERPDERAVMVPRRCFNCGAREHLGVNCPTKNLGTKCFECGKHGHIAAQCRRRS